MLLKIFRNAGVVCLIALSVSISAQTTNTSAARQPRSCATRPEFRALDFWLGEWEQKNGQGRVVGSTSVKAILDGCALFEITTNPGGGSYVAQAFHYYDPALGKWQQTYIDTTAFSAHWTGEAKDGEIRYTAERPGPGGANTLLRSIFIKRDADRVEQIFEQSLDGGKTWTRPYGDVFYVRKK